LTKSEIILGIYNSSSLRNYARSLEPALYEDLFSEVMVILLEYDEARIIEMKDKGYINFFVVKILSNLSNSKNSPFYYKFKKPLEFCRNLNRADLVQPRYEHYKDRLIYKIEAELKKDVAVSTDGFGYEVRLLNMYLELGSLRKVARKTGINYKTISLTINDLIKRIKKNVTSN